MAAILELAASFLGPAIELGKCIAEPVKRQLNYLCCFNSNVQNLKKESKKLDNARGGLQMRVTAAENNAEVIVPEVKTWLEDVDEVQEKMTAINREITNIQSSSGCLSVKSRYSLGKKVKKTTEAMEQLQGSSNFDVISQPAPSAATVPIPLGPMGEFDSRKDADEEIMRYLGDDNINVIGICGMGGVGKTTMAKKIMNRARGHLFAETVMAVVSQKVDVFKIQKEIAELLDLKLEVECLSSRAHKLRTRLSGGKRILIVLDDVWEKLNLEELGIPCESGSKECTVLLTSRDTGVFNAMDVQKVRGIQTLSEKEAWSLFKEKAGTCVDDQNLLPIAQEIAEKCQGLPLALVTVGVALKNERQKSVWEDALQQLKSSNPENIPEVLAKVYTPLKLSYDFLESGQARSMFLLCCLFPEDYNIPLEFLTVYAMGLGMFKDTKNLGQARNRTCLLIKMLKSRFLLLEGRDEYHVKMHDVVRDVSIFIASKERHIDCNDCTWVSPFLGERIGLSIESKFPNLLLLLIDKAADKEWEINDNFFQGMIKLKVLSIESCDSLRSLPHTTQLLKNLRTLILDGCKSLESISVVGELLSLEILICRRCDSVQDLPVEMGRLTHLKLIEFSYCESLEAIAPGVISRMVELEELKMVDSFDKWEAEVNEGNKRKNAGLRELESLTNLTRLEIEVADCSLVAKQIHLSPKIVKFDIAFGNVEYKRYYRTKGFHKKLHLGLRGEISLGDRINVQLLRNTEYLHSEGDGSNKLDLAKAQNMRSLSLRECWTMKKLVNITTLMDTTTVVFPLLESLELYRLPILEGICNTNGPDQGSSNSAFPNLKELTLNWLPALKHLRKLVCQNVVSNLSSLEIYECDSLHNLFLLATAKDCLFQLESLTVTRCEKMEHVLLWNQEDSQKDTVESRFHIAFPKLKRLELRNLPNLTAFYKGMGSIEFPLLTGMVIKECPNLKSLVSATCSIESGNNQYNSGGIRHDYDDDDSLYFFCGIEKGSSKKLALGSLPALKHLWKLVCQNVVSNFSSIEIYRCDSLCNLFSLATAKDYLSQLESLTIVGCKMMEQVLLGNQEENQRDTVESRLHITFPKLEKLKLRDLPKLTSFYKGMGSIEFPLLTGMEITKCPNLKSLVSATCSIESGNNQYNSGGIRHDHGDDDSLYFFCGREKVASGSLETLSLGGYSTTSTLWCHQIPDEFFTGLGDIMIENCGSIRSLFSSSIAQNLINLRKLRIWNCCEMVKVIEEDKEEKDACGGETTRLFPNLKILHLECLSKLKSFCEWRYALELPSLEEVRIKDCPEMERYSLGSLTTPPLKKIHIENAGIVNTIHLNDVLQVEDLEFRSCQIVEQVVVLSLNEEENEKDIGQSRRRHHITFPKLKTLILYGLPNLTTFCKRVESIEFPLLTVMAICDCTKLKSFVSTTCSSGCENNQNNLGGISYDEDDVDSLHLFCNPKVVFGSLKELHIKKYNSSILWCDRIPIEFFSGLKELWVVGCDGIRSLFSSLIARNLVNLHCLGFANCHEIIKVIEEEEEEKDACGGEASPFPNLKRLYLWGLPKLKSFCHWECALKLESLILANINDCPQMERFSLGFVTTPNLESIHINRKHIIKTKDLNGTLQQQYLFIVEEEEEEEKKKQEEREKQEREEKEEEREEKKEERKDDPKIRAEIEEEKN